MNTHGTLADLKQRQLVMGILNITPDSFSDAGSFVSKENALEQAYRMKQEGATIIDVGGEATWPGAQRVGEQEEIDRVIPVIEALTKANDLNVVLSIETYKPRVADLACSLGAQMINDVTGGNYDSNMFTIAAKHKTALVIVHTKGLPEDMKKPAQYDDLHSEIKTYFLSRLKEAKNAGVERGHLIIDPGIGFFKGPIDNLRILNQLESYKQMGHPVLIGTSRKFVVDAGPNERLGGSIAAAAIALYKGVSIVRCHDVRETVQALRLVRSILGSENSKSKQSQM